MTEPRLSDYVQHIQEAAQEACDFMGGRDLDAFLQDTRTQRAVVMCLLIVGEASTKIMDLHTAFAQQHRDVPWQTMRNMRNRMAHGYFNISLQIVWETVRDDLPSLIPKMKSLGTGQ